MSARFDVAGALALARQRIAAGGEAATAVVVESRDAALVGRRLAWDGDRHYGDLGSARATAEARALLESRSAPGCHSLAGGTELYVERWEPPAELVVVGAGHVAQPLALMGNLLGYRVTVLDDRPEFATSERFPGARVQVADLTDPLRDLEVGPRTSVVLVTRGHRHDYDCLRELARRGVQPRYVGMIGSRRRVRAAFEQLAAEGVAADWLARVHAPLGLDIGAETPAEIAVAVAAEMVLAARGGSARPLSERAQVLRHVRGLAAVRGPEER